MFNYGETRDFSSSPNTKLGLMVHYQDNESECDLGTWDPLDILIVPKLDDRMSIIMGGDS